MTQGYETKNLLPSNNAPKAVDNKPNVATSEETVEGASFVGTKVLTQINPASPEGLVPPPHTVDTHPEVFQQLKKPLIPENQDSENDLRNVHNPNKEPLRVNYVQKNATANVSANATSNMTHNVSANISANVSGNDTCGPANFTQVNSTANKTANLSVNASANITANHTLAQANASANHSSNASANKSANVSKNLSKNASKTVTLAQINPGAPEGLVPPPRTVDTNPEVFD